MTEIMERFDKNLLIINELNIFFLDSPRLDITIDTDEDTGEFSGDKEKKLVCYLCQSEITSIVEGTSILGRHVHSKINPAGFAYHFACYNRAPGCITTGQPEAEHTWFPGYLWQVASCKNCLEHLGWFFSGNTCFYGLIQGRVVQAGD